MAHRLIEESTRVFTDPKVRYSNSGVEYTSYKFSRSAPMNISDIAHCAELSFHKALIGIAELCLLEEGSKSLRLSKAVQAYYVAYHLFVCAMLLDDRYDIIIGDAHRNYYEADTTY